MPRVSRMPKFNVTLEERVYYTVTVEADDVELVEEEPANA